MKKIITTSLLIMTLCLTLLPVNAYAQGVDAGIGYSRTNTHTTSTTSGWHKTTDTHSTTRGAYGNVHIDGVNAQQVKNFYKNEIRPYSHAYLRNSNNNNNRHGFSYNASYNPPSFQQPSFHQPSFGSMGHFNAPSAPSFGF